MRLRVVEEVGPVGVGLHVPELKQLPEAQHQDVLADLERGGDKTLSQTLIGVSLVCFAHLVLQLLRQVLGLVQGEPGHQLRGEDVATAQLVDHLRYVEEGVVLQQLAEGERPAEVRRCRSKLLRGRTVRPLTLKQEKCFRY